MESSMIIIGDSLSPSSREFRLEEEQDEAFDLMDEDLGQDNSVMDQDLELVEEEPDLVQDFDDLSVSTETPLHGEQVSTKAPPHEQEIHMHSEAHSHEEPTKTLLYEKKASTKAPLHRKKVSTETPPHEQEIHMHSEAHSHPHQPPCPKCGNADSRPPILNLDNFSSKTLGQASARISGSPHGPLSDGCGAAINEGVEVDLTESVLCDVCGAAINEGVEVDLTESVTWSVDVNLGSPRTFSEIDGDSDDDLPNTHLTDINVLANFFAWRDQVWSPMRMRHNPAL